MKLFAATAVLLSSVALQAGYNWSNVQILGGGYVPGIAFHPAEEGLAYIRTDVGGAYRLEQDNRSWNPLNDMFDSGNDMGSIAIGLDPSDPSTVFVTGGLYLPVSWCNGASVFKSGDKGTNWTRIPLNVQTVTGTNSTVLTKDDGKDKDLCLGGNAENRGTGNRIAVSGNTVYLGTDQNGLLKSTNGGSSWTTVGQFSNTSGISAVQFDKDGNIYAAPFAGGLYKSSNGTSWSQISGFSGVIYQVSYNSESNTIWFTTNTGKPTDQSESSGGSVYKYNISTETLTKVTMPSKGDKNYGYIGISVNPNDSNQIFVSTGGWWKGSGSSPLDGSSFVSHEAIFMSTDGGSTWKDIIENGTFDTSEAYNAASNNPHWISALAVNPHDKDHVVFGTGYGVWSTFNATSATPEWIFTSRGIEETKPLGLVSTKYGAPLVSVLGDIDGFYHSDVNTPPLARHKVGNGENEAGTNYDIDYAGQQPNYMVRIHKDATYKMGAYSQDGGKTWTDFGSIPPSGSYTINQWNSSMSNEDNFVAVSADASAIVWNMSINGVYYSTDNGTTWTRSTTTSGLAGFRPVADKVTAGTFYLYNSESGSLYKSTNDGSSWSAVSSLATEGGDWARWAFRLYASPDNAGELWVTQGVNSFSNLWLGDDDGIKRSTDGGANFTKISNFKYARSIGFGKGSTADGPSAVYAVGKKESGEELLSVFRSDNSGGTWTRINDDAYSFGEITMVIGDPCVYSRVFLGTEGRGIIHGFDPNLAEDNDCPERVDYQTMPTPIGYSAPLIANSTLIRQGNILRSSAPIRLYTLKGKLVANSPATTLDLSNLPNGVYIARSGAQTLKVLFK